MFRVPRLGALRCPLQYEGMSCPYTHHERLRFRTTAILRRDRPLRDLVLVREQRNTLPDAGQFTRTLKHNIVHSARWRNRGCKLE